MSGIADGIILLGILAVRAIGNASNKASHKNANTTSRNTYNRVVERQQQERMERRNMSAQSYNAVNQNMNLLQERMNADIDEQYRFNQRSAAAMQQEIAKSREKMALTFQSEDEESYAAYINELNTANRQLTQKLFTMQQEITTTYQSRIADEISKVSNVINVQYNSSLMELQQLQNDTRAKQEKALQIANDFISEGKNLIQILENEYEGEKYSGPRLLEIKKALNDAVTQYNMGNYEAAIAAAKNTTVDIIEEIYKTDARRQEWENYYGIAAALAAELKTKLEAQEIITEDIKNEAEKTLGTPLDSDIVGINIGDYTDTMPDGQSQYKYLLAKANEINSFLMSEQANGLTTMQLKEYIDLINTKLYPAAEKAFQKGIFNMNNAFSRQNISEEIIDFFEEHNFEFKGYSYENDKHDGALHIGLENDVTGEEIVVTLAPELMGDGQVQTKVEINQLKGDETNEERKAFYRRSIQEVVVQNTPGAQIKLECRKDTHNKLSNRTDLRDKIH